MENKYYEDFTLGERTVSPAQVITEEQIRSFCSLSGCMHPVHLDQALCRERFGNPALLAPGTLLLSLTDGAFASFVSPSTPFCPHYGYDKVRFVGMAFSGDVITAEFIVKEKAVRNRTYGLVSFQTTVRNQDGATLLAIEDKLAVPFRDTEE